MDEVMPDQVVLMFEAASPKRVTIVSPAKVEVQPNNPCQKEHTMTTCTMALAENAKKCADDDVLRQMVKLMAQRLMRMDAGGYHACGGCEVRCAGSA